MTVDCFTCPQPANYAAIALQLQKTAMDAEACIYDIEVALRGAANRPTFIAVLAAPVVVSAGSRTSLGFNWTTTFANSSTEFITDTPPEGIYETGVWLNATATGATTDNSFRQLELTSRTLLAPSSEPDASNASVVYYESSSGAGMDMLVNTTVILDGAQAIQRWFLHNNASNISIAAGAIAWWTRISDSTIPRVVT